MVLISGSLLKEWKLKGKIQFLNFPPWHPEYDIILFLLAYNTLFETYKRLEQSAQHSFDMPMNVMHIDSVSLEC